MHDIKDITAHRPSKILHTQRFEKHRVEQTSTAAFYLIQALAIFKAEKQRAMVVAVPLR